MASLSADIAELDQLLHQAKRPHVRALLAAYAAQLRSDCSSPLPHAHAPSSAQAVPTPVLPTESTGEQPAEPMIVEPSDPVPTPEPQAAVRPVRLATESNSSVGELKYTPIGSHSWDQDSYGTDPSYVYVYILSGFEGIGQHKDSVKCEFSKNGFDLKVTNFKGKSYRLVKTNLEKNIVADQSNVIVKKNSIKLCLRKEKGQYGYETWMELTAKRPKAANMDSDPGAGIMDMMKQMYDDGDDNMKKVIGEAMVKSRQKQQHGVGDDL